MAIKMNELWNVHSGGAANTDPAADLGGAISTAGAKRVKSQSATSPSNVTGITIDDAFGNAEGVGSLSFVFSTGELGWKPYGQTTYYGVDVSTSGTYLIGSSSGYMVVTSVSGSLPASDKVDNITVANLQQNIFPNVNAADSLLGITEYRCLYILNTNGSDTASDVRLWIASNTPGGDTIDIGLDPAGLNATATTIGDGETAPAGVTFSAPGSYGTGLAMGNIPAGQKYAYWLRRTVPVETRGTVISNGAAIAIGAFV